MNLPFLSKLLAPHFRKPSGLLGWYAARTMSQRNVTRTQWTIDACDIRPGHVVLEIGFGPGYGLAMAAERAAEGTVYGLDFSSFMVKMAARKNRGLVAAERVVLVKGDLSPAPFQNDFFDRIFAVNVAYFWPKPLAELSEIKRILKPGGRAVLYLSDRLSMDSIPVTNTGLFTKYTAQEFMAVLSGAVFARIDFETKTEEVQGIQFTGHCFVLEK